MNTVDNEKKHVIINLHPLGLGLWLKWRNVMIDLTSEALEELKNLMDNRRDNAYGVRLFVKAVG